MIRKLLFTIKLTAIYLFILLSCVILADSGSVKVGAVDNARDRGLTVSPLRSELNISPGTAQDGVITVINSTNSLMTISLEAEEFSVINQQYDYAFTAESNVAKWVSFSSDKVTLKPGESRLVKYSVGVPLSSEPGGRYISLFVSTSALQQNQVANSRQRIASLLYITVLGDVSRFGKLVSLSSPWLIGDKSGWSMALQNKGTTHYRSRYAVSLLDIFGSDLNIKKEGSALILPGTVRLVSDLLPRPVIPGVYRYKYLIGLGDTPASVETRLVFYIPLWFTLLIFAAVIILALKKYIKKNKK